MGVPLLWLCHTMIAHRSGTDATAALCSRRLLSNLRVLTLSRVKVPLPALQPVAGRLRELEVSGSRLQGSADGFLTMGWTALTSLTLISTHMEDASLTTALELPALKDVCIVGFDGHLGGLQLDQLTGSCPQISRLEFQLSNCVHQATKANRQSCGLLNLECLTDLHITWSPLLANVDLDLPPSLTQLTFEGYLGKSVDFFWALREAVKCVGRGAQLHRLICECAEAHLHPTQWGASLEEQHRQLGGQLGSLRELEVLGASEQLLSAVGAVASAAPSLTRLEVVITSPLRYVEVSAICSASLESIRVEMQLHFCPESPPQVLLTFLPGCTRLREVVVVARTVGRPIEGAAVKIRCHCSQRCIVPVVGYASSCSKVPKKVKAGAANDVVVNFVHMPCSEQGVQECTLLYACHAAGPKQAPLWGFDLMQGIL